MSLTIKRLGASMHVLNGAETLPEGEEVELFTANELSDLQLERREWLDMQMLLLPGVMKMKTSLSSSTYILS